MFKLRIITLIIAGILIFSSCALLQSGDTDINGDVAELSEQPAPAPPENPAPPEDSYVPKPGGIIKIDSRNPKTFNPILNEELSVDRLLRLAFEPLISIDENMKPTPGIASAWEFSPDGASLTLHIRENAVWDDGTQITADDVKYTLDCIRTSPETALYNKCAVNILDYAVSDKKTIKINYVKPFSGALYNMTFPVIPMHHFSGADADSQLQIPVGSGLYKLEEFNTMRNIRLVSNPLCYRGTPNIPEIEAIIVRDLDSPLYAYDQKILDMAETNHINWKKISTTRQSNIFKSASAGYEFLALNLRRPALRDINIRKAIAHSTPKTEIIDKIYAGNAFKTDTPVNPQSWLYEPDTLKYEYDLDKARNYMSISAYHIPEGESIGILVNNDNSERTLTAEFLRESLADIGIICNIETVEFEEYAYRIVTGDFDIAVCGLQMSLDPDLTSFLGNLGGVPGEYNFADYKDDVMDGYLAQAGMSVFEASQISAYSNIQKRYAEDLPYISILYKANVVLAGKNVYGNVKPVINNAYNNIGELYIRN